MENNEFKIKMLIIDKFIWLVVWTENISIFNLFWVSSVRESANVRPTRQPPRAQTSEWGSAEP